MNRVTVSFDPADLDRMPAQARAVLLEMLNRQAEPVRQEPKPIRVVSRRDGAEEARKAAAMYRSGGATLPPELNPLRRT